MPSIEFLSAVNVSYFDALLPAAQTLVAINVVAQVTDPLVVVRVHRKQSLEARTGLEWPVGVLIREAERADRRRARKESNRLCRKRYLRGLAHTIGHRFASVSGTFEQLMGSVL